MATYYVDPNVAGPGSGDFGDPWKEIGPNTGGLNPGDIMMLRAGTYDEGEIVVTVDGTGANPITFRPYGAEVAVMHASTPGDYIWELQGDWLIIDGISTSQLDLDKDDVAGGAFYFNGCQHCILRNTEVHHARWIVGMVRVKGHHNTIEDCIIHHNYNGDSSDACGISIQDGSGHKIIDCTIYDVNGDCIIVSDAADPKGWEINGCTLYTTLGKCSENGIDVKYNDTNWAYILDCHFYGFRVCDNSCGGSGNNKGEALGLRNSATKVIVEGCTFTDSSTAIVCDDWVDDIIVRGCKIYALHTNDPNADSMSGLWLRASGVDVYNCTFYDCPENSVYVWVGTTNSSITNCIFSSCGVIDGEAVAGVTWSYNCWHNCTETKAGAGDVNDNPDMVNPGAADFTLQSVSPCIDAGTDVGWVFYGTAPDMGAEEYPPDFTLDALIVQARSGTFTGNATIEAAQTGAATADATIKDSLTGTATLDAVALRNRTGTAAADAIVKAAQSGSATSDSTIKAAQTGSATADAAIKDSLTGIATLDAVVGMGKTGTATVDAALRAAQSGLATCDAAIKVAQTGSVTMDAVINTSDVAANLVFDAVVKAAQTGTFTIDARIEPSTVTATFTADAAVLRNRIGTANANAVLLRARTGTATASGAIKAAQTGAATVDATIEAGQIGAATVDAAIKAAKTGALAVDGTIKAGKTGTTIANAAIKAAQSGSTAGDATIKAGQTGTVAGDAAIKAEKTGAYTLDAAVKGPRYQNLIPVAAALLRNRSGSFTIGATLIIMQSGALTLDAYVYAEVTSDGPPIRSLPDLVPKIERAKEL